MINKQNTHNLRILIIEDSPVIMTVHKQMVEIMGFKPDCAVNGEEAIKFFQDNEYDVVLSDLGLPDIDGIALAERFRLDESMSDKKETYIVAITAFVLDDIRDQCFDSGINDVFAKPLNDEILISIFKKARENNSSLLFIDKMAS